MKNRSDRLCHRNTSYLRTFVWNIPPTDVELRVDANGAFSPLEALEKLQRLSDLQIHSIEQPIRAGQYEAMARLCETSPLPIALDEELIGIACPERKKEILQWIKPAYIILKPSLIGGYRGSEEWITLAEKEGIAGGLPLLLRGM